RDFERFCSNRVLHKGECSAADPRRRASIFSPNTGGLVRDLPTLSSNSIYFNLPFDPIVLHSLGTGLSERLAESCKIHDGKDRIRPSVRPFTMADHLMTYCHTPEWSKGLMFHEYQHIPESFKELIKNIRAQDVQVRIPRIG
uniref:Uncharacterized protein n=1 Tax=Aegilops tauschii subsp. strangulata TaxID=200361 RepID=A0A452YC43_AEGTS